MTEPMPCVSEQNPAYEFPAHRHFSVPHDIPHDPRQDFRDSGIMYVFAIVELHDPVELRKNDGCRYREKRNGTFRLNCRG